MTLSQSSHTLTHAHAEAHLILLSASSNTKLHWQGKVVLSCCQCVSLRNQIREPYVMAPLMCLLALIIRRVASWFNVLLKDTPAVVVASLHSLISKHIKSLALNCFGLGLIDFATNIATLMSVWGVREASAIICNILSWQLALNCRKKEKNNAQVTVSCLTVTGFCFVLTDELFAWVEKLTFSALSKPPRVMFCQYSSLSLLSFVFVCDTAGFEFPCALSEWRIRLTRHRNGLVLIVNASTPPQPSKPEGQKHVEIHLRHLKVSCLKADALRPLKCLACCYLYTVVMHGKSF